LLEDADAPEPARVYLERRRIRCGKRCRCAAGRLHGPFSYVRLAEVGARRRRIYIPKAIARSIAAVFTGYRRRRADMRLAMMQVRQLWK
jgi:hypothetical protein